MFNPSARMTILGLCLFIAAGCGSDDTIQLKPVDVSTLPSQAAKGNPKPPAVSPSSKKLGGRVSD